MLKSTSAFRIFMKKLRSFRGDSAQMSGFTRAAQAGMKISQGNSRKLKNFGFTRQYKTGCASGAPSFILP